MQSAGEIYRAWITYTTRIYHLQFTLLLEGAVYFQGLVQSGGHSCGHVIRNYVAASSGSFGFEDALDTPSALPTRPLPRPLYSLSRRIAAS